MMYRASGSLVHFSMNRKDKRIAIISGAGGGLGKALVRIFLNNEFTVYALTSKSSEYMMRVLSGECDLSDLVTFQVDMLDHETLSEALKLLGRDLDKVDVLINSIGGEASANNPLSFLSSWPLTCRINLEIPVQIIEFFSEALIRSSGKICNIGSISGVESQGHPGYGAAKAALIAYTRSVGRYLSSKGVSMFCVSPGAFDFQGGYWDRVKGENYEKYQNFLETRMAIGRLGEVDEVANFIYDTCACVTPYVAGNNFIYDGGQGRVF